MYILRQANSHYLGVGYGLDMIGHLPGARGWLSNGLTRRSHRKVQVLFALHAKAAIVYIPPPVNIPAEDSEDYCGP